VNRLLDRVCLVTGSTGIGAASARRFAAEGGRVFVVSRTADHVRALVDEVAATGGEIDGVDAELTDEAAVRSAVEACVSRFGRIDGLFSVAGGSGRRFGDGPIHTVTRDAWDRTLRLNLTTQALVTSAVVADADQAPNGSGTRGSILFLGNVTASGPRPSFRDPTYAAAKGALTSLMTTMAAAYLPDRIRSASWRPA
jgi:NAD(P)-dependent dehydrogenase (short-subunit alcohol dehydrogenase family)